MLTTNIGYHEAKSSLSNYKELSRSTFVKLLEENYKDYSLSIHGIRGTKEIQNDIAKKIMCSKLLIDDCYQSAGTIKPRGLIGDKINIDYELDYFYGNNKEESYNILVVMPTELLIEDNRYFVGYPRKNETYRYPKNQPDYECLMTILVDTLGYIPKEFILGCHIYGPDVEKIVLNPYHVSFLPEESKKILAMEFGRVVKENNLFPLIEVFGPNKNIKKLKNWLVVHILHRQSQLRKNI